MNLTQARVNLGPIKRAQAAIIVGRIMQAGTPATSVTIDATGVHIVAANEVAASRWRLCDELADYGLAVSVEGAAS